MKLCVLVERLPGDGDVVGRFVTALAGRHQVTLALTDRRPSSPGQLGDARVVAVEEAKQDFDVALATTWPTTVHLFGVTALRYVELVQSLEFEAFGAWQAERLAAVLALDLPVDFIATDSNVADAVRELRPDARVFLARAGMESADVASDGDIIVVPDGSPAGAMRAGSVPIVFPANVGPVQHMVSGVIAEPDDEREVERWIEFLRSDSELRERLRAGAIEAVAGWPTWDQAATTLEQVLEQLVAEPPPPQDRWPFRLMGDVMAGVALLRQDHFAAAATIQRLQDDRPPGLRTLLRTTVGRLRGLRSAARSARRGGSTERP